jgi:hypothetical protein
MNDMHLTEDDEIMPITEFSTNGRYEVEVTGEGVTVYSECCSETVSYETALKLRDAITVWLTARKDN